MEHNQLLGTGQFRLVTVQVPAARTLGLLTDYVPELPAVAEQLAQGQPLVQQLSEPPSLAQLARACQLNEFSLKRGFRQLFGGSVGKFVQAQRLEGARHLLLGGGQTVTEIAYQLGYAPPQHFHRAFKKHFGCTPKQLTR